MDEEAPLWDVVIVDDLSSHLVVDTAHFFNEHFPGVYSPSCTPELFRWKLGDSNPAGLGLLALAISDGSVVGVLSATAKTLVIDGRPFPSAEIGDAFTSPRFRKAGHALIALSEIDDAAYLNRSIFGRLLESVTQRLQESNCDFVYATPAAEDSPSRPGFLRRGTYTMFEGLNVSIWHRPTFDLFEKRFPRRVAAILYYAFRGVTRLSRARSGDWSIKEFAFSYQTPFEIYNFIDELWNSRSHTGDLTILLNGAYFRHRYGLHPDQPYSGHRIFRNGKLVGLLVTRQYTDFNGNEVFAIADWLFSESESHGALVWAIGRVCETVADSIPISLWTNNVFLRRSSLWRLGFVRSGPVAIVRATENKSGFFGADKLTWDLRLGATDNV